MANDDRVRAAVAAYVDKMEALHDAQYPDAYIFPCMSAALDAADAVALTPTQMEAEGILEVLRVLITADGRSKEKTDDNFVLNDFRAAFTKARAILAHIEGEK